jgi:hypothetical protein
VLQKVPRYCLSHDDHYVRAVVWAYCPLLDWTGTPPGLVVACHQSGRGTLNAEIAWPRGLTSGSALRLTSRAAGHVVAPGPRLSGERRRAWQDPDKCLCRTLVRLRLRLGYSSSRDLVVDGPDLA